MSLWKRLVRNVRGFPEMSAWAYISTMGNHAMNCGPPSHFCQGCEAGFRAKGTGKRLCRGRMWLSFSLREQCVIFWVEKIIGD